ncbi:ATP-binding cassette domain-containing protein [Deinococcus malanensis]
MLTVRNLQVAWGDQVILKNVHLNVRRGERIVLTGVNGSGKSSSSRPS